MTITVDAAKVVIDLSDLSDGLSGDFAVDALQEILDNQVDLSQNRVPRDTNTLHDSIQGIVSQSGDVISGIYEVAADYGIYVEFPTERHFVPERYIGDWAVRHGFARGGLVVTGNAQPFVRRHEGETLDDVADRMSKRAKTLISKKIKKIV